MSTRIHKIILASICGVSLGAAGCANPQDPVEPTQPPADVDPDPVKPQPEPAPPQPPDHDDGSDVQPMYGVPMPPE